MHFCKSFVVLPFPYFFAPIYIRISAPQTGDRVGFHRLRARQVRVRVRHQDQPRQAVHRPGQPPLQDQLSHQPRPGGGEVSQPEIIPSFSIFLITWASALCDQFYSEFLR